jgi:hypothetical protein
MKHATRGPYQTLQFTSCGPQTDVILIIECGLSQHHKGLLNVNNNIIFVVVGYEDSKRVAVRGW